jgi:hypothetical protein
MPWDPLFIGPNFLEKLRDVIRFGPAWGINNKSRLIEMTRFARPDDIFLVNNDGATITINEGAVSDFEFLYPGWALLIVSSSSILFHEASLRWSTDMPKDPATVLATIPSRSTSGTVYTVTQTPGGTLLCSCPGYIYSKRSPRSCRHTLTFATLLSDASIRPNEPLPITAPPPVDITDYLFVGALWQIRIPNLTSEPVRLVILQAPSGADPEDPLSKVRCWNPDTSTFTETPTSYFAGAESFYTGTYDDPLPTSTPWDAAYSVENARTLFENRLYPLLVPTRYRLNDGSRFYAEARILSIEPPGPGQRATRYKVQISEPNGTTNEGLFTRVLFRGAIPIFEAPAPQKEEASSLKARRVRAIIFED